tara:strand:- start:485 stop:919 length:435 start_codon:yes stop_codon:yes gene_type:complete
MKFSNKSKEKLETCHMDLQKIFNRVIEITSVDFGISEGYRTVERQKKLFDQGKSKIDGINKKGKHNYNPSQAVDIYAYYDGKARYDLSHMSYLAGLVMAVGYEMYAGLYVSHKVRWGGNWDGDGKILIDQRFDDTPHFELIGVQ